MRILSYNIHGGIGRDGHENHGRILEVIQQTGADIVGLQEVHRDDARDRDFLRELETLPYRSVIYGKTMRKPTADYGNLLLLREPPLQFERVELPNEHGEPRGAIIADTTMDGQDFRIISTHLDLSVSERKKQMEALLQYLPSEEAQTNCILLGDLNEWLPLRRYFRTFRAQFKAFSSLKTFPARHPIFLLDRIAVSGQFRQCRFKTGDSRLAKIASDHRPLVCDLEM
ncbi:MAG: endonuclease/exonuclease/phosphatase family protein [Opitutales bacterium]